jgi:hypothetical protein
MFGVGLGVSIEFGGEHHLGCPAQTQGQGAGLEIEITGPVYKYFIIFIS